MSVHQSSTDSSTGLWVWDDDSKTWATADQDALRWCRDGILQCAAETAPTIRKGEVVLGRRCMNMMRIGYPKWFIVPTDEVPRVLCHAHRKGKWLRALLLEVRGEDDGWGESL